MRAHSYFSTADAIMRGRLTLSAHKDTMKGKKTRQAHMKEGKLKKGLFSSDGSRPI